MGSPLADDTVPGDALNEHATFLLFDLANGAVLVGVVIAVARVVTSSRSGVIHFTARRFATPPADFRGDQ